MTSTPRAEKAHKAKTAQQLTKPLLGNPRLAIPAAGAALALVGGVALWSTAGRADATPDRAPGAQAAGFTVAAAGDIAEQCTASNRGCEHPKTAALMKQLNPAFVLTMGDNQYDDARLKDFQNYYDKSWGTFKDKTHPVAGNHETYDPDGELAGYKAYFGSVAYPDGKSYYSFDQDNWHFIALDSNSLDSSQLDWLKSDLAANSKKCVAAYWHHPLFSSGEHGNDPVSRPVWKLLYDAKAELVLNGHDHHYERFAAQDPDGKADKNGLVELLAGVGGANPYKIEEVQPNSEKRLTDTFGVVKLNFTDTGFSWDLVDTDGNTKDSSPSYECH
ncbi:alkaline phosphatase [Streptomyces piniterrae]|uniref:Alkaline phosphatase n=1 Tax=Streptomyces piniterrae TaxID=2571125 RepID=A0A4U0NQY0_9ACTN|nr:metallophosphoesterase [Streptomyces piniterrae]TJZ56979.1 alkaline phosphatase [Streptomyces piniterrae]